MDTLTALPPYTLSIVIGVFFLINLLLGLYKGRNVKTFSDYAVADYSLGTGTLAITIIATIIGSRYVTTAVMSSQEKGIVGGVVTALVFPFFVLLFAYFIFPTLLAYRESYTLGDVIGKMYGKEAQIFTGLVSIAISIILIAAQLLGVSHVAKSLGLNPQFVILGLGLTIILYTWVGGIRSVAFTDILQFVCLAVGFLFLAYRVLQLTDKNGVVIGSVERLFFVVKRDCSPDYFKIFTHKRFYNMVIGYTMLVLIFLSPPIMNRVLVAKNTLQMQRSFYGFAFFYPILRVLVAVIGFGLLLKHGKVKVKENLAFAKIAEHFFSNNPWAMVMLFVMLLAVVMSTADSFLNSTVVVVIRDLIGPLSPKSKRINPMKLIPYIAFLIGGTAIGVGFLFQGPRVNDLVVFAERGLSIVLVPIVFTVLRLKPHKKVFWSSVIIFTFVNGVLFFLGHYNYLILDNPTLWQAYYLRRKSHVLIPIALLITFVLSLVAHYIVYGKFVLVPKETFKQEGGESTASAFWQALKSPLTWATDKLSFQAGAPVMVGLFLSLSWMLPELTTPQPHSSNLKVLLWVRILGVFLCSGLLLHNRWKAPFKRYYPLFYYVALGYGFPFSYALSFFYNPNNKTNTMLLVFALIVLMILVNQRLFVFLTAIGGTLAFALAKLSPIQETLSYNTAWHAGVSVGYTLIVSFFFIRFKDLSIRRRIKNFKTWTLGYNHDMAPAHSALINFPRFMDQFIERKVKKITKEGKSYYRLDMSTQEYESEIKMPLQFLKSGGIMADALPKAFDQLIKDGGITQEQLKFSSVLKAMQKGFLFVPESYKQQIQITVNPKADFKALIHEVFFANIISNLVKNAVYHADAKNIEVGCNPTTREVYVKDDGKGIPRKAEPYIFNLYFSTGSTGVGLPFIRQLVEGMGGKIRFTTSPQGTTFFIYFPKKDALPKPLPSKAPPLPYAKSK